MEWEYNGNRMGILMVYWCILMVYVNNIYIYINNYNQHYPTTSVKGVSENGVSFEIELWMGKLW